tara:strand:- start:1417 stop:1560 length:144 start_codon:yes stop_codon:yes gene_type:complete
LRQPEDIIKLSFKIQNYIVSNYFVDIKKTTWSTCDTPASKRGKLLPF